MANALQQAGIDFGLVGNGWPKNLPRLGNCQPMEQPTIMRKAKVVIGMNNFHGVERYYSNRQFVALASGTPVVCHYVPNMEKDFTDGVHCLFFRNATELVEKVKYLLDNPEKAKEIGRNGRNLVFRRHTWYSRVLQCMPHVEAMREELIRAYHNRSR